jgi:hypothetical protein
VRLSGSFVLTTVAALACLTLLLTGCADDDVGGVALSSGDTMELYPVVNVSSDISFVADEGWTASCAAPWLTFFPQSGGEGANTITVSTTQTNRTHHVRSATMTIVSGGKRRTVTITQRSEYAVFDDQELTFPPEGGTINMTFRTNVPEDDLKLYRARGMEEWIPELSKSESRTRATEHTGSISPLTVLPNTDHSARDGTFYLAMLDDQGNPLLLDTLFIHQAGMSDGYSSQDYSADGKVVQLNTSTQGKGIPIVLMGDGFQDRDIHDGTYAQVMNQAMENLFSEEPLHSLRDYFDVYAVNVVSKHNIFGEGYETALHTMPSHQTMAISMDTKTVMTYVRRVEAVDSLNTFSVVILNTNMHRGVTYMFFNPEEDPPVNYSISLCPIIDSLKSETFRTVLVHEAVGHAFAKLGDEYVRAGEGSATESDAKWLHERHGYDLYLNVDSERDTAKVIWSRFVNDPAFADEHIGTYEGAYTFYKGMFRPTEESMMRSNDAPFNAPSRQAIYNRVMLLATGQKPTYEAFVAFDREHRPTLWSYRSRTRQSAALAMPFRPAPPLFIPWPE